jgi:hypothetical protein
MSSAQPASDRAAPPAHRIDWRNPDERDLVAFVHHQYVAGKARRRMWEERALENLRYAAGEQDFGWSEEAQQIVDDTLQQQIHTDYQQPVYVPTLHHFVLQRMALLLGVPITWIAHPTTTDDQDVAAARLQQKLLQYQWSGGDPGFLERLIEGAWQMFCTGLVFMKVTWDDSALPGPQAAADRNGGRKRDTGWVRDLAERLGFSKTRSDHQLDPLMALPPGAVRIDFPTGFELTEPVGCWRVADAPWLMQSQFVRIAELRQLYGGVADELTPDNQSEAFSTAWTRHYGPQVDADRSGEQLQQLAPAEHVLVHELWRPRCNDCPEGMRAVVADYRLLECREHPYAHGRHVYVALKELPEQRFRPGSTVGMLVSLQAARNRHRTHIAQHLNRTMVPHILAPKGAHVAEDFLQARGGVHEVEDDYIQAIQQFEINMPPYAFHLDEIYRADMMDVAGVHSASLGVRESTKESGRHAALLQESDARGNSITRLRLETALGEAGRLSLWLYWQYVSEPQLVTLAGGSYGHEASMFKGSDLWRHGDIPGPTAFNVEVKIGTEPDAGTVLQKIQMLISVGALNPMESADDRGRILRMLGELAPRDWDDDAVHRSNAAEEHRRLLDGDVPLIAIGDNDALHIQQHERWSVTDEFRSAEREDPGLGARLWAHMKQHHVQAADKAIRPRFIAAWKETELTAEYQGRIQAPGQPAPAVAPQAPAPAVPEPGRQFGVHPEWTVGPAARALHSQPTGAQTR